VARLVGVLEIDRIDLEQREVALAVLGRADMPVDGVAGAQSEAADLRGRDVDVVGAGEVVGFGAAEEAEPVLQHLEHAVAEDGDAAVGELLQDRKHHVLLAQRGRILDLELLGEGEQLGRGFPLEFLEIHRLVM
jgi:hypothetical protein